MAIDYDSNIATYGDSAYHYDGSTTVPASNTGLLEWEGVLNQLAGTKGLGAEGAANVWAGTKGLGIAGALNTKAGNAAGRFREIGGVCNQLAGTKGMEAVGALNVLAGNSL